MSVFCCSIILIPLFQYFSCKFAFRQKNLKERRTSRTKNIHRYYLTLTFFSYQLLIYLPISVTSFINILKWFFNFIYKACNWKRKIRGFLDYHNAALYVMDKNLVTPEACQLIPVSNCAGKKQLQRMSLIRVKDSQEAYRFKICTWNQRFFFGICQESGSSFKVLMKSIDSEII